MGLLKLARMAEEVGDQVELVGAVAGEQLLLALGDQRPDQLPGSAGGGLRRAHDHLAAVARVGGAGDVASLLEAVEHAGDTARGQAEPVSQEPGCRFGHVLDEDLQASQVGLVDSEQARHFPVVVINGRLEALHRLTQRGGASRKFA